MAVQYAFGKIITQGLDLNVDAADPTSYPGTGTAWTSVVNRSITGSIVSCSFSSDFKGGIVFDNPSASVEFPGTVANYGTGSFTVEMAFRPAQIEGIHYLVSKNSGSYPNWGVYLSGSGGSGKLFAEYNIDASVSCSVSSSTTFETDTVYQADINLNPVIVSIILAAQGQYDAISPRGNGTGSLTSNGPILIGNIAPSSSQAYSGSIFNTKIYNAQSSGYTNYKVLTPRFGITLPSRPSKMEILLVGGGGGGGSRISGGGGAGGYIITSSAITSGTYTVTVGAGGVGAATAGPGTSGGNTAFGSLTAYGGGGGGNYGASGIPATNGENGSSGGGGGGGKLGGTAIYGTQGTDGANGLSSTYGGGGGGASTPGSTSSGGSGSFATLFANVGGSPAGWFAGGGGGGFQGLVEGIGGIGGGANGSLIATGNGGTGSANTGGGGGGSRFGAGGDGGSGIVIIRYPGTPIATGGTITSVAGDTIHTFTETGSHTFTVF